MDLYDCVPRYQSDYRALVMLISNGGNMHKVDKAKERWMSEFIKKLAKDDPKAEIVFHLMKDFKCA
jgi:hypothetical protein